MARKRSLDGGPAVADEILRAAAELFYTRGYGAVSIRDIAQDVAISSSTIYHHFVNKQEILHAVIKRFMVDFADAIVPPLLVDERPAAARIADAVRTHLEFSQARRPELLTANPFRIHLTPAQQRDVVALQVRYNRAVTRCITQGVADGSFSVEDPAISTMAILDMLNGVREWFRADDRLRGLDDVVRLYQQLTLHMLGSTTRV